MSTKEKLSNLTHATTLKSVDDIMHVGYVPRENCLVMTRDYGGSEIGQGMGRRLAMLGCGRTFLH